MVLLTNLISLGQPGGHFRIHIVYALEAEGMQMISPRERFDAPEAAIFNATSEHDMAVDRVPSNNERGKTHPHLKRNPGLFWKHGDWPICPGDMQELVENRANGRRFSFEMGRKRIAATRMRLIPVCKLAAAFRTTPQGSAFVPGGAAHSRQ
jgi:hypothetical protein